MSDRTRLLADLATTLAELSDLEGELNQAGVSSHVKREFEVGRTISHRLHNLERTEEKLAQLEYQEDGVLLPMNASWVISCATLVFLMQLGFAQLEAGFCRPKSVIATYLKNVADFVLGAICTLLVGFAIAYGQWPIVDKIEAWKFFFHLVFQATASTILSGAMAERINVRGYLVLTTFLSAFVYATAVSFTWGGGFLSQMDPPYHDFAGSGVVHLIGGAAALAGTYVLGARKKRWERPDLFVCHSVPQVLSGVLLLWVGWYGFNPGSTGAMSSKEDARFASNAAMTTTISGATAGSISMLHNLWVTNGGHIDLLKFCNCILGGLVAITAGSNVLSPWTTMLTGAGAVFAYQYASARVKKYKIDDVVDAFAVHGCCGAWGCIAVGLFHPDKGLLTTGSPWQLLSQVLAVLVLGTLSFAPIWTVATILNRNGLLRCSAEEERKGIDMTLFRVQAYNNFQDPDGAGVQYYHTGRRTGSGLGRKPRPVLPKLNTSARDDGESGTYIHRELNLPNDTNMGSLLSTARTETQRSERGKVEPKLVPTIWGSSSETLKGEDGLRAERIVIGGDSISALLVCDGHDGAKAAEVVIEELFGKVVEFAADNPSQQSLMHATRKAFFELHAHVRGPLKTTAGTTVTIVLINETRCELTCCNVGDSFVILVSPDPADAKADPIVTPLTTNPRINDNVDERKRVVTDGGQLGYMIWNGAPAGPLRGWPGGVMCASSIGDSRVPFISPEPFTTAIPFPATGGVVLVASDGVWDGCAFPLAAKIALAAPDPAKASRAIVKQAISLRGLRDDTTCICAVTGFLPPSTEGDSESFVRKGRFRSPSMVAFKPLLKKPDNQLLDLVTDPDPSNHTSPEKLRFGGWSEEDRKANDQKRRYSLGQLPSVF